MANAIATGKAQIDGIGGVTFTVLSPNPTPQTGRLSVAADLSTEKDGRGFDNAWRWRNLHYNVTWTFVLQGTTFANAQSSGTVVNPGTKVTIASCEVAAYNGDWVVMEGASYDLGNTKAATMDIPLRRYADSSQNSLATTTVVSV